MFLKVLVACVLPFIVRANSKETVTAPVNTIGHTNDMYVIHATHYEVGILTNNTDVLNSTNSGVQEAITIFKSNGSTLNLGNVTALLQNVTGESVVGVAQALVKDKNSTMSWLLPSSVTPQQSTPQPGNAIATTNMSLMKPQPIVLSEMEKAAVQKAR